MSFSVLRSSLNAALLALFVCLSAPAPARAQIAEVGDGRPGPVKAEHLTVELVTLSPQIPGGGQTQIGLSFTIEEHWHVYWVNAGDSGEPPSIKWTLPKGITARPMQFPPPQRLPLGPLMDFGYQDQATFPILLQAAPRIKPGKVHLDAHITWLVCSSVCIPGKAHLGIDLNVVNGPLADPPLVGALGAAIKGLPTPLPPKMSATAIGSAKEFVLTLKTGGREEDAEVYPFTPDQLENAADQEAEPLPDGIRIRLKRSSELKTLPADLHVLVKLSEKEAYDVTAKVTPGALPPSGGAVKKTTTQGTAGSLNLMGALGLAFVGGILLNLMPCVFPVLFLKGLALVNSSTEEQKHQRAHGLMYTLGILISFWAVVGTLLVLRAGGTQFGWGFQLQSPTFVALLAALLFFLGLSLAGQFELGLSLTSAGGSLAQKQGYAGSFFTGVLATVVATPCTAPLMGAAVGFALAQPPIVSFAVFTMLALGLALPYLLLSWHPAWVRVLPRPGAWMEILKQLTAVPLFATAIGLAWVYGHLFPDDGVTHVVWLLVCFLALAIAGWALGRWPARWGSAIAAVLLIVVGLAFVLRQPKSEPEVWQPYSAASLEAARATGKPVFVDFTAAWCLSCKVNEAAVLKSTEVLQKFDDAHVVLLRADWTQHDAFISQQLADLGRSGVPTYVIYPPGANSNPDVLPELLTKSIVLNSLEKDLKASTPKTP
jgi:thiol:disulfide interchange protein